MSGQKFSLLLGTSALFLSTLVATGCPQATGTSETGSEESANIATGNGANASTSTETDGGTSTSVSENGQPVDPTDATPIDDTPITPVVGDYDGDQKVSESDIRLLSRSFGSNLSGGDLNADGKVDILDLAILLTLVQE